MKDKIIIGILPALIGNDTNDYFQEKETFVRNYGNRLSEYNATPIGIILDKEQVPISTLELCDGFILPGGNRIERSWYETIDYAIKHNKPLLGICLGSEAIDIYSVIKDHLPKNYTDEDIIQTYQQLKKEHDGTLLSRLPDNLGHFHQINKDNIDIARHKINIQDDTILKSIFNSSTESIVSLHHHDYKLVGKDFIISATASDNTKEAIEYKDKNYFILGVHFHPELEKDSKVIKRLIEECIKRKNI